ncbi:hypothetical protein AVV44_gp072 [Cronobacter phage S13]|jgi:hypothetical protein|uniref:Uncharacterized protein n=1 Tax=Cronobacter phage LPCS28 TaxID=2924885 RepID=A0AAE9G5H1_9CAUD|nr:hypothetical protein AVV44_gp072 [Cronobacter phage S13]YP_010665923.1 hypothetical protein PQB73_gp101 [Cronobacter phage LPCS28]AIA64871.1 hypothetical protein S13_072 [Cronobacter phage S13]UNY47112.1 hypothetical protein EHEKIMEA_00230 [Cronobacter phage LPCS28]
MRVITYQYNLCRGKFEQVGWAHKAETYFKMMGWKIPDEIHKVNETKKLYYCLHEPCGSYHWTKEGLLDELRENGIIS